MRFFVELPLPPSSNHILQDLQKMTLNTQLQHHWWAYFKNNISDFVWNAKFSQRLWRDNRDNAGRIRNLINTHVNSVLWKNNVSDFVWNAEFSQKLWRNDRDNLGRVENLVKSHLHHFCTVPFNLAHNKLSHWKESCCWIQCLSYGQTK